jgi:IPT/TIG domain
MIISNIFPQSGTPGSQVTITGNGFGDPVVTFGNVEAEVTQWDNSGLVCIVPNVQPGMCFVTVSEGNANVSTQFNVLSNAGPTITGFFPQAGAPGTEVTISGSGFGADSVSLQVFFDDEVECDSITVESDTELLVTVPEAAQAGDITVVTAGGQATSDEPFDVQPDTTSALRRAAKLASRQ